MKKLLPFFLTLGILISVAWAVNSSPQKAFASAGAQPAATAATSTAAPAQPAATGQEAGAATSETRPQATTAQRRSYERETGRRHHSISKKELIFLGAIAGTSMGIGAIAAGAHGLAIGTIVGGWAAFGGHFLWKQLH
jgi:hypothetical protein